MQETLFPLEFFIQGTPKSLQASPRSKALWMEQVGESARTRVRETVDWTYLDDRVLSVTIFYFAPARMEGDSDNIVKPIMDAMIKVAYNNDQVVERVLVQKFELDVERTFADVSLQLAVVLDSALPVVYVRVDDDLAWRRL